MSEPTQEALVKAVLEALDKREPVRSPIPRWLTLLATTAPVVVVLVGAIAWATRLQASLDSVATSVAKVEATTDRLSGRMEELVVGGWTRADQAAFMATEYRPLEARVRALEARLGTH